MSVMVVIYGYRDNLLQQGTAYEKCVPACRRRARGLRPALRAESRPSGFDP